MRRMVVDGGSTKCHWLAFGDGPDVLFASPGLNPLMLNFNEIVSRFLQAAEGREVGLVDEIYYYGAGCIGGEVNSKVAKAISQVFGCQSVVVYSDILGAARATLGRSSGIACILGTGCNSCHYDGENIVSNIPPLGYILGDEGSGADIGKRIVADALKGLFDNDLTSAFWKFAGCGYGKFKPAVGEAVVETLRPIREEASRIMKDKAYLEQVYKAGAEKASYVAEKTLRKVYKKVGFVAR